MDQSLEYAMYQKASLTSAHIKKILLTWKVWRRLEMSKVSFFDWSGLTAEVTGTRTSLSKKKTFSWFIVLLLWNCKIDCSVLFLCHHLTAGYETWDSFKHELFYCSALTSDQATENKTMRGGREESSNQSLLRFFYTPLLSW